MADILGAKKSKSKPQFLPPKLIKVDHLFTSPDHSNTISMSLCWKNCFSLAVDTEFSV